MNKKYYFIRLVPRRPDFSQTMTEEERGIMLAHAGYWREHMKNGNVVVFGPVFDPKGAYGMGVVAAESEEELAGFLRGDPAGEINDYEYFLMRAVLPE
jgi:hypothetical protein